MSRLELRSRVAKPKKLPEYCVAIAREWRDFYRNEIVRNPKNPSARGRIDLMQRAIELLESTDA